MSVMFLQGGAMPLFRDALAASLTARHRPESVIPG